MKVCTWLKPREDHVVVFIGKGSLIKHQGLIKYDQVGDPDVQWGSVAAVHEKSTLKVEDVVVLMKFNGIEAPSPHHGLETVIIHEKNILSVVDVGELVKAAQAIADSERAAADRLAADRARQLAD